MEKHLRKQFIEKLEQDFAISIINIFRGDYHIQGIKAEAFMCPPIGSTNIW